MAFDTNSIVDYLKSQGKDSSYSARKKLAQNMGISNYSGTASQNAQMLNALKKSTSINSTNNTNNTMSATTSNTTPKVKGADESLVKTATSTYKQSSASTEADKKRNEAQTRVEELTSKDNIVSQDVWNVLGSSYTKPIEVIQADAWLGQQLSQIQSGKTSYSDDVRNMISKIQNREKFEYDVDSDQLFQQALASAIGSGKQAMQDTIGQVSALTGGYGSTYATSVGNQAYNSFIEDAYDNLPQYYQMAFDRYQAEGQDMYNQLAMLSEEDAKEYERLLTSYDATYKHRNQLYNESYNAYRDSKTDAYNMANLQLSEHGQLVSNAYNYYNTTKDYADTVYNREYTAWADSINQAMQMVQMQNSDYWSQLDENYRRETLRLDRDKFDLDEKEFDANYVSDGNGGYVKRATEGNPYSLTDTEAKEISRRYNEAGGGEQGVDAVYDYLEQKGKMPTTDEEIEIVRKAYEYTGYNNSATTTPAKGLTEGFKTNEGDNFKVSVNNKTYRVENQGEVKNKDLINDFNNLSINDGEAFLYNADNRVYVKKGDKYYKTGATEILGINTPGHGNLKEALYAIANGGK